jgi:hypothetical protein
MPSTRVVSRGQQHERVSVAIVGLVKLSQTSSLSSLKRMLRFRLETAMANLG